MALPLIRQATAADANALLVLEDDTFSSDRIPPRQMRYLLTRARAITWVAVEADQILGYVMLLTPRPPRPCRVYSLAVDARHRGRHIASLLMRRAIAHAREQNYRRLRLEVRAPDHRVQAIYQGYGFRALARIAGYYQDGEDAVRMELALPD